MITVEEFLKELDEESGTIWTEDDDEICKAFIEFAKLHVTAALKAASEKVDNLHGGDYFVETILTAYSLDLIK
jgi:hypothetical protein